MERTNRMSKMNRIQVIGLASIALMLSAITGVQAKDLPGSSPTSWGVSQSGGFQFSIPIAIPAGRNGMQPKLSIGYSSGGGNGSMGVGWGVSGIDAIYRCGQTYATHGQRVGIQHSASDRFCLNGQPLILVSSSYGAHDAEYRTEIDGIAKIVAANGSNNNNVNEGTVQNGFVVWRKDGSRRYYGATTNARFYLPGTSSIHAWKLSKVMDKDFNYYEVTYNTVDGLPERIDYTARSNMAADKWVGFEYETRPDVRDQYIVGSKLTHNRRLAKITANNSYGVVRDYRMSYEIAAVTGKSRLSEVKECGLNNACFAPIDIEWANEDDGFVASNTVLNTAPHAMFRNDLLKQFFAQGQEKFDGTICSDSNGCWVTSKRELNYGAWADVNGDGELDQIISVKLPNGSTVEKVYIKDKAGNQWADQTATWKLPEPLRNYDDALVNHQNGRFGSNVANQGQLADVNGDGLVDVVYAYRYYTDAAQNTNLTTVKKTYINNGNGWTHDTAWDPKDTIYDYVINGSGGHNRMETIRARLVDINGDGLPDWVRAYYDYISGGNGTPHIATWLNNGNGWNGSTSPAYALPDVFVEHHAGWAPLTHGDLVDVNGDGLLDWVQAYQKSGESLTNNTWLNGPDGFGIDPDPNLSYRLPEPIYDNIAGWDDRAPVKRGSFVDVNGDGLADFVRSYQAYSTFNDKAVRINTGKGWTTNTSYSPPFIHLDFTYTDRSRGWPLNTRGFYIDLNRDGLVDYTQAYKDHSGVDHYATWMNDGSDWGSAESSNSPYYPSGLFYDYSGRDAGVVRHARFLDVNNDGAADLVKAGLNDLNTWRNRLLQTDKVAQITTTMGVEVQPEFEALTDNEFIYQKTAGAGAPQPDARQIEAPMYVVSSLRTSSADGSGWNTTTYQYGGAQAHRLGRGFLGFKWRRVTNDKGIISYQKYRQDYPYIGRIQEQHTELNGQLISESSHAYQELVLSHSNGSQTTQSRIPYRRSTLTKQYEAGQYYRSTYQRTSLDDYANVTESLIRVGVVTNSATLDGVYEQETITDNVYEPPVESNWKVNLLSDSTVTSRALSGSPKINHSHFEYDARGRLTDSQREPNSTDDSVRLLTTYVYDIYGNVTRERVTSYGVGAHNRDNTIGYDAARSRLPISLNNALTHGSTISYHPQCDQPSTVTDMNGVVTNYSYDDFCRQQSETIAATATTSAITSSVAYATTGLSCLDCQTAPKLRTTVTAQGQAPVVAYSNLYGQTMVSVTSGMFLDEIRQRTEYDTFGRVKTETQPYFSSDTPYTNTHHYDPQDRLTYTTLPFLNDQGNAATIRQDYVVNANSQLEQISTNTQGRTKTAVANALGQIVEIRDAANESMAYEFDPQGNLVKTIDTLDNEIIVVYDAIGRRKELQDPDLGTSLYSYNGHGELIDQTDAKNQIIEMEYDKLSRMTKRTVPGSALQSGGDSHFYYDTATNGIGQPASITGPNGYAKTFNYDVLGRPLNDSTTIQGSTYTQSVTYNDDGQLASRTYPNSGVDSQGNAQAFGVKYGYMNGYLAFISSLDDQNGNCIEHWRANHYDALGRSTQETLGTIISSTRGYSPTQGVLETINSVRTVGQGGQVQDISYSYDANNNLKSRSDSIQSSTETFDYDNLDRLTSHTRTDLSGTDTTTVAYNEIGNITYKSDVGTYTYHQDRIHALVKVELPLGTDNSAQFEVDWEWDGQTQLKEMPSIHGQTFSYDDNGNVQTSGNREFDWTAFDKPQQMRVVDIGSANDQRGSNFLYDASFERIVKEEANYNSLGGNPDITETTHYLGKDYQRITDHSQTPAKVTHRYTINAGSNAIQIERDDNSNFDQASYMLTDALGSTNVIIDAAGEETQRMAFDPWGMRTNTGDTTAVNEITNRGYTGHEMDDEIGLINMNARIYDPYLGRFLSADPVLPDAGDMQAYNRYAYVINNPLKYTDPTGNAPVGCDPGINPDSPACTDPGGDGGQDHGGDLESEARSTEPLEPRECSRSGARCEADRNGYDDRDESRDRYEEYFEYLFVFEEREEGKNWRPLTQGEISLALSNGLTIKNITKVRVYNDGYLGLDGEVIAPNGHIYIGPNNKAAGGGEKFNWSEDYSKESIRNQSIFLHELAHVYQNRTEGCSVRCMTRRRVQNSNYNYQYVEGKAFHSYGIEEQAEMVQDRFLLLHGLKPFDHDNKTPLTYEQLDELIPWF